MLHALSEGPHVLCIAIILLNFPKLVTEALELVTNILKMS